MVTADGVDPKGQFGGGKRSADGGESGQVEENIRLGAIQNPAAGLAVSDIEAVDLNPGTDMQQVFG